MTPFPLPYPHYWYWKNARDFRPQKIDGGYYTPIVPSEFNIELLTAIRDHTLKQRDIRRHARDDLQNFYNERFWDADKAAVLYFGCNPQYADLSDGAMEADLDSDSRELRGYIRSLRDLIKSAQTFGTLDTVFKPEAFRDWLHTTGAETFFIDDGLQSRPDDLKDGWRPTSIAHRTDTVTTAYKEEKKLNARQVSNELRIILSLIHERSSNADKVSAKRAAKILADLAEENEDPTLKLSDQTIEKRFGEARAMVKPKLKA